jgi:hypothetical protein
MTVGEEDLALQTLLVVGAEKAPLLDEELLRQCYAVEKKYQFSDDRAQSAAAIERLIDAKLASLSDNDAG